jgi:hypothetical protein
VVLIGVDVMALASTWNRSLMARGVQRHKEGWAFHIFDVRKSLYNDRGKEMTKWLNETYGLMDSVMSPETFSDDGRWILFPLKEDKLTNEWVIGFENEKMMLMWKMNFGDVIAAHENS